ncbi:hypothetical protein H109_05835 [Trichophyton interdigitale MR816]|uniref:Uncharacterized protein n=1 Tax=Trichophyton interdigitale (strain MR816) TaxID=1215338 RepID=A0A059J2Z6_TRIIM|nr:hypothetical protein H109_05835 [Trichophyton interdigitale MR816]
MQQQFSICAHTLNRESNKTFLNEASLPPVATEPGNSRVQGSSCQFHAMKERQAFDPWIMVSMLAS